MLTDQERAVVLAALRFWQRRGPFADNPCQNRISVEERAAFAEIATDGGLFTPLTECEIDRLCEQLNGVHPSLPDQADQQINRQLSEPCDCQRPGYFCSGVPGILAHMEEGGLSRSAQVERCDLCCRYPTDEAARAKLCELGFAHAADPCPPNQ